MYINLVGRRRNNEIKTDFKSVNTEKGNVTR